MLGVRVMKYSCPNPDCHVVSWKPNGYTIQDNSRCFECGVDSVREGYESDEELNAIMDKKELMANE